MEAEKQKTILVVEDDSVISSAVKYCLEDSGYGVLVAPNGLEALTLLETSVKPAMILLDLMMPVLDGFQFREKQLANPKLKDIPVVIMSADGHIAEKKVKTTAAEYLKKPFDIFVLLETVQKYSRLGNFGI